MSACSNPPADETPDATPRPGAPMRVRLHWTDGDHSEFAQHEWLHGYAGDGTPVYRPAAEYRSGDRVRPRPQSDLSRTIAWAEAVAPGEEGGRP